MHVCQNNAIKHYISLKENLLLCIQLAIYRPETEWLEMLKCD